MVSYAGLATTATNILTNYGADATVSRTTGSSYNAATGSYSGGSSSSFTNKAARFNYTRAEIDGVTVLQDDLRLVMNTENGTPLVDDSCAFDSVTYRVMSVTALSPDGTDIYYELQLRR